VAGRLDEVEGLIDSFPSLPSLHEFAEKNAHNLATEILTILFPPPEHPWIGELFGSMRGLAR
jgi:hypothetical protein